MLPRLGSFNSQPANFQVFRQAAGGPHFANLVFRESPLCPKSSADVFKVGAPKPHRVLSPKSCSPLRCTVRASGARTPFSPHPANYTGLRAAGPNPPPILHGASPSASATSSLGRIASRASLFVVTPTAAAEAFDLSRPSVLLGAGAADCCQPLPLDCDYSGACSAAGVEMQEGSGSNFDESDMFSDIPAEAQRFAGKPCEESTQSNVRGTKRAADGPLERRVRGKAEAFSATSADCRGAPNAISPSSSLPWWVLEALGEEHEGEGEVDGCPPASASPADSACSAAAGNHPRGSRIGGGLEETDCTLSREFACGEDIFSSEDAQSLATVVPPSYVSGAGACLWSETLGAEDIGALLQAELCGDSFTGRSVVAEGEGSAEAEGPLDDLRADAVLHAQCFADEAEIGEKLEVEEREAAQWDVAGLGMWCWEERLVAC
ncbi:unnamed protein product [Closterium sp. NIES-65]|nr:unnamed protein product [Closterium sp. NIES-65]